MADFTFIDLFAGIGGMRLAFESAGGRCNFSSEWDAKAAFTYEVNFGHKPHGDITNVWTDEIPDHDVLLAGFPCQPFSIIGKRQGFADTRGTLFHEIRRILDAKRPQAVLLENVKAFKTHDGGKTCETVVEKLCDLGYEVRVEVLNALDYGVAQRRERTFIVGLSGKNARFFSWPEKLKERAKLEDVLEPDDQIPKELFASKHIREKRIARLKEQGVTPFYPSIWHENKGGHISVNPYSCALRAGASYNYLVVNGVRRPTGRELLRLQGFPDTFSIPVHHSAIRKQAGNSVAVPCVAAIAREMAKVLKKKRRR